MAHQPTPPAERHWWAVVDLPLKLLAASIDQPITDVPLARRFVSVLRAAQRQSGHFQVTKIGAFGELLNRVAVTIATFKIHPRVDTCRIFPQNLLGQI